MKNSLLVTLADKNYLNQAKQLFSSAYFNAGWKGDYMLLTHDIPKEDSKWFTDKGILIKECKPLFQGQAGGRAGGLTAKFYLFTPEFKKWDNIVYLDVDIIIRASVDNLTKVKGFSAISEIGIFKLSSQFIAPEKLRNIQSSMFKQIEIKYDLKTSYFNTGILAFNANLIEDGTFNGLNQLMTKYKDIILQSDQTILNLFFYKKWKKLSPVYNFYIYTSQNIWRIKLKNIKGIVIHFHGLDKPWNINNYFYPEWKSNLDKADKIDLRNIPAGKKWSQLKIISYSTYLHLRYLLIYSYYYIDNKIGKLGIILKKYSPRLYHFLKKIKK